MTATDKLAARIASLTTEQLLEISLRMTLATTGKEILVATYADRELERRLPEADFLAHLATCEALLDAAA